MATMEHLSIFFHLTKNLVAEKTPDKAPAAGIPARRALVST